MNHLLDARINLCKEKIENQRETCQYIFPESFTILIKKILTGRLYFIKDSESDMYDGMKSKCEELVELCALNLDEDVIPLLDLLATVFDPNIKFNTSNAAKMSESVPPESNIPDDQLYARPLPDPENPHGWLVDLINKFGNLGGFVILLSRFQRSRRQLTIPMIHALLRPFGLCHKLLTVHTIDKYFLPIVERVQEIFYDLTDEKLKKEVNSATINLAIIAIMTAIKSLVLRVPQREEIRMNVEALKLRMMLKLRRIFKNIPEKWTRRIFDSCSYHLNQYYESFQEHWLSASGKIREKKLEIIQRLAVDDEDGVITHQVLTLLWNDAHLDGISTEKMYQTLDAQVKVLDSLCLQDCDAQKFVWLDRCVEKLKNADKGTLPALKHIRYILHSFEFEDDESDPDPNTCYLKDVIYRLENQHSLINLVINNLKNYMDQVRELVKDNPETNEEILMPDGRYNHAMQVHKRLVFIHFIEEFGGWSLLEIEQTTEIWQCLVEQAVFPYDREICFMLFSLIMNDGLPSNATFNAELFLKNNILQLDPTMLTPKGIECFQRFFVEVRTDDDCNYKLDELHHLSIDYLWRVCENSPKTVAKNGFEMLHKCNTDIGKKLQLTAPEIHKTFIAQCKNRVQFHCDALAILTGMRNVEVDQEKNKIAMVTAKMNRVIKFMQDYINECSWEEIQNQSDE